MHSTTLPRRSAALVLASVLAASFAPGAVFTWTGAGGDNNLNTALNWAGLAAPPSDSTADLHFVGSTRLTPNVQSNMSLFALTFDFGAASFTLGGSGILTLSTGGLWLVSPNAQTINGPVTISSTQSWHMLAGSGGLTLGGALVLNAPLTVNAYGAAGLALNGVVSGSNTLTKSGGGSLTLGGVNTYTGATNINAGTLLLNHNSGFGSTTSSLSVTVASGATLRIGSGIATTTAVPLALNGSGLGASFTGGALEGLGNATYSGLVTLATASTIASGAGTLTLSNTGNLGGAFALTLTGAGNGLISGNLNLQSVIKNGGGTWTLAGTNTTTAGFTVNAGTLALSGNNAGSTSAVTINGGTLLLTGSGPTGATTVAAGGTYRINGANGVNGAAVTVQPGGLLELDNATNLRNNRLAGRNLTFNGGALNYVSGSGSNVDAMGSLALGSGGSTFTFTPNSGGGTQLTSTSATRAAGGTLTLVGRNFADPSANGSVLHLGTHGTGLANLGGGGAGGTSTVSLTPGIVARDLNRSGPDQYSFVTNVDTGANGLRLLNAADYTSTLTDGASVLDNVALDAPVSGLNGTTTINSLRLAPNTGGGGTVGAVSGNGTLTLNSGMILAANVGSTGIALNFLDAGSNELIVFVAGSVSDNLTINASISGAGLTKAGAGQLTLAQTNSYSGPTTVNEGTLTLSGTANLGLSANALTLNGGTLDLGGTTQAVGSFTVNGAASLLNGTLQGPSNFVVANAGGVATISANLNGGTLTKSGNGTLVLSGANSFNTVSVTGGTISIPSLGNIGTNGPLGASGTATFNAATLLYTGATATTNRVFSFTNARVEIQNAATNLTLDSTLSGGANLTKVGLGTLTLAGTGDNISANATVNEGTLVLAKASTASVHALALNVTVNGGTLRLGGTGGDQIFTGTTVTMNGGTFDLNGLNEGFNLLTGNGGVVTNLATGTTSVLTLGDSGGSSTYSGTLADGAGQLALTKALGGTLTLLGTNTYSGPTVISGGALSVNTLFDGGMASAIGNSSSAASNLVLNGGTLQHTGVAASTNRLFTLGAGGGTLNSTGNGLSFTSTGAIDVSGAAGARQLTLAGSGSVVNTFLPSLADNAVGSASSLRVTGGTWVLGGASTYSGGVTITGGTLRLSGSGNLGASTNSLIMTGGTLDLGTSTQTVSTVNVSSGTLSNGTLSGTAYSFTGSGTLSASLLGDATVNLLKSGTGTLSLTNTSSYAGTTTVLGTGSTLALTDSTARLPNSTLIPTLGGAINVTDNAAGSVTRAAGLTFRGGTMSFTGSGGGNTVNNVTNAFSVDVGNSTLTLTPGTNRNLNLAANSLQRTPGATLLVRGSTLGTQAVGANATSSNVTFTNAPTALLVGGGGAAGTANISILPFLVGDTILSGNGTDFVTYGANGLRLLTGVEYIPSIGPGGASTNNARFTSPQTLSTPSSFNSLILGTGGAVNGASTLTLTSGALLASANAGIGDVTPGTLAFGAAEGMIHAAGTAVLTIGSGITGTAGISKGGTGTLTLGGNNSFSGGFWLNAGTLNLAGANAASTLGTGLVTINGGTLNNVTGGSVTLSTGNAFAWNGDFSFSGTSALDLGTGPVTLGGGSRTLTVVANTLTVGGVIADGGANFGLVKAGAGILALNGANTYTGITSITGGTLSVNVLAPGGSPSGLGQSSSAAANLNLSTGATLRYTGVTASTDRGFTASGTYTFDITQAGTNLTLTGANSASGTLTKLGLGTLSLGGSTDNPFGLIASAGTVVLAKASSATVHALNALTINGGTVQLAGTGGDQIPSLTATINSGVLDLNGRNESIGGLAGSGGTVTNTAGTLSILSLAGATANYGGIIANGTGGLAVVKDAAGTQTLSGANTYTGGTTITGGTLALSGAGTLGATTGTLTMSGGTLDLGGTSQIVSTFTSTLSSGTPLVNGSLSANSFSVTNNGSLTMSAVLQGSGAALTKAGSGTLTLSGANTYSGATSVTAGTLNFSGGGGSPNSAITLSNGAALTITSNNTSALVPRAGGVTLGTATPFSVIGNAASNTIDQVPGSLSLPALSGLNTLTITAGSGRNTTLFLGNILRSQGSLLLVRGASLGAQPIGSGSGTTNLVVTAPPPLIGGGGPAGSPSISILPYALGDASTGGNGTDFVTHTPVGFRLLTASEYSNTVVSAVTTNNYRLNAIQNPGGAATFNSLILDAGSGLAGNNALTLTSGAIFATASATIGTTAGSLNLGAEGIFTSLAGANLTINAPIFGSQGISKFGAGDLTLGGSGNYSGGLTLFSGRLNINVGGGGGSALGTGTFTINGGSLDNTSGASVSIQTSNIQAWNADFTFAGSNSLNLGTGAVTLGASRTVTVSANTLTVGGAIGDGGNAFSLTKAGLGTLTLNGASTYTGVTTVNAGTLTLGASSFASPTITIASGATLNANTTSTAIASRVILNGNLTFTASFAAGDGLQNNSAFSIPTGRTLTLNGTGLDNQGVITLSGTSVLTGTSLTNAVSGSIRGSGTIGGTNFLNNGSVFVGTGNTLTFPNAWTNAGIVQLGDATAVLAGAGLLTNNSVILGQGSLNSPVANQGAIQSLGGTLTFGGAVTNPVGGQILATAGSSVVFTSGLAANAGIISLSGGTFSNGANPLVNNGTISGYGTFTTGGTGLTNNANLILGGAGTNTLNGPVTNALTGTITVANTPATFNGDVVNDGRFVTVATNVVFNGSFTNNGIFHSDPSLNTFGHLTVSATGSLFGEAGDAFVIRGDLLNYSQQRGLFDLRAARLTLAGTSPGAAHLLAWSGSNLGAVPAGFFGNFAVGRFELALGNSLTLADGDLSTPGAALYVHALLFAGGLEQITQVTGNGVSIYYDLTNPENAWLGGRTFELAGGGFISPAVPEPGTAALLLGGAGALFLGRRRPQAS